MSRPRRTSPCPCFDHAAAEAVRSSASVLPSPRIVHCIGHGEAARCGFSRQVVPPGWHASRTLPTALRPTGS